MKIREAELRDTAAMARVSVESYRATHRDQLPEASLRQFTYEESERNRARTIRELREATKCQKYVYIAESDEGLIIGIAMGGPERNEGLCLSRLPMGGEMQACCCILKK